MIGPQLNTVICKGLPELPCRTRILRKYKKSRCSTCERLMNCKMIQNKLRKERIYKII